MVLVNQVVLDSKGEPISLAPQPSRANSLIALAPGNGPTSQAFRPDSTLLSSRIVDPDYVALKAMWSDRRGPGRIVYDSMCRHVAVAAPLNSLICFLKSCRPHFKPSGDSPTELQKQLAAFANAQLARLGNSGDPRQGYEKFIEWIGQGLRYGFSLAEMETRRAPWGGQSRIQVDRIIPLPQATLDDGYVPLEEYASLSSASSRRYRCFTMDSTGRIVSVHQYHGSGRDNAVTWSGADLLRILHFVHKGSEGNPFGESILFSAFYHWASLYTLEQMEEAMMDAGLPYLTVSYETPDGRSSPALHADALQLLKQQDPVLRVLIMPDTEFGSISPSNPAWVEHATKKKAELRSYIRQSIFGADMVGDGATAELDARNVLETFFSWILPSIQNEVANLLTWQFSRRLIDTNWSGLNESDYPRLEFGNLQANDLRIAMPLLQMVLPYVASDRLGELLETFVDGFDREWIPPTHESSVAMERASPDPAVGAKPQAVKPQGTPDTKYDGQSRGIGKDVDVAV